MKKRFLQLLSAFLAIVLLCGVLPLQVFADVLDEIAPQAAGNDPIVVIAGSDFQDPDGHEASSGNVSSILTAIKQKYSSAYGFLFAGDYDYNYNSSATGIATLKQTVQNGFTNLQDMVLAQGNHDPDSLVDEGVLSASGDNDTPHYGVFVINEQDYMHNNTDKGTISATASALDAYLSAKVAEDYTKPVFILSHLPLHYSMRTYRDGDAKYAAELFTVINNYARGSNLDIIYLYGHNHSHGWDDYLGGSSVFLRPGNVLLVGDGTKDGFDRYTIGFTYMNAGFTGYYEDMESGADTALTMTTFAIYSDRVEINRFDTKGAHKLKAKGYYGADYGLDEVEQTMYDPSARIYEHTETIYLDQSNSIGAPEYTPETEDHGWIQISAGTKTVWRATNTLTNNKRYLILDNFAEGTRTAAAKNSQKETGITEFDVVVVRDSHDGNYVEEEVSDEIIWTYKDERFTNATYKNTTYYLQGNGSGSLRASKDKNGQYTKWKHDIDYGLYTTKNNNGTKYYVKDDFSMSSSKSTTNRVFLFVEETITQGKLYASFLGSSGLTIPAGVYGSYSELTHIIRESFTVFTASDTNGTDKKVVHDYTIEGEVDPTVAGRYTLSLSYQGVEITKYVVNVKAREIISMDCNPMTGSAALGSSNTGSILTVHYSDGTTGRQYVTLDMLEGDYNLRVPGVYENLTIVYGEKTITGYSLNVYVNNYPEFPHEGSIRVNKGATGIDLNNTGVARVELAATGVPVKRGADVIIMLDTSSSMTNTIDGATRIDVLNEALADLVNDLQRDGEDGEPMDIRISIADFNNYFKSSSSPYYLNTGDILSTTSSRSPTDNPDVEVYTGDNTLTAGSMVDIHDLVVRNGRLYDSDGGSLTMSTSSGTNYDYAFDAVYQIASSVKAQNEENNEERDLFVIFMSDGGPFQYNYFSSQSTDENWNKWLTGGNITSNMYKAGANQNYFNPEGKHWMAEAIKGDPNQRYTVIRKNTKGLESYLEATGTQNIYTLPGLGATMFSIGFCLAKDQKVELSTIRTVLQNISSNKDLLYYECKDADELHNTFHMIGQEINYAATDAYFVDVMGNNFDLQMSQVDYRFMVDDNKFENRTILPEISFTLYGLYTHADVEAGTIPHDMIGTRNGRSTVVETVVFNADGTEAYIKDNTTNTLSENILKNGVIYARNFWYNTNDYSVMIDTDLDGVEDYLLANETFYWDMGTINNHDMVLSYYVYLNGSMEGTLPAGVYETNQSAILYYTNWLGNAAYRETVSPQIPWQAASVRYAFYLVDENGLPLVNQEMGMTGSFANRLNITTPTFYALLNSTVSLNAAKLAAQDLPEGYELYDKDASYTVHVSSARGASAWTIGKGDVQSSSTYVTGHNSYQFTNVLEEDDPAYDYTHTIVWFAVVYTVKPVSDVVVIDFGLPVNIQVLMNDMFYNKGGVVAVGPVKNNVNKNGDSQLASEFLSNGTLASTYEGKYGTATITPEGIRYTLRKGVGMNMEEPEIFSYAVLYEGKYFYGLVTVIPATSIYYEESFISFENAKGTTEEDTVGIWSDIGSADLGATQAVDRPGFNNLDILDANYVYGFDMAYRDCVTYSNNGAKIITVNEAVGSASKAPYATFTFTGTGFDVISLTDNTAGTILVSVYNESGRVVASKSVNNYYGYSYTEEGWVPEVEGSNSVWQVPVIKFSGLAKATYTVKIHVIYLTSLEEDLYPDASCTFVLDAIRIYDPAKGNETADNAHKADKEYAPYYLSMKDLVLGTGDIRDQETIPGVVFIDGKNATNSFDDYDNPGPNNELYLAKGQGISFKLTANAIPTSTQIGLKMAFGENGVIKHGTHDFVHVHGAANVYHAMNDIVWNAVTNEDGEVLYYETPVITLSHSDRVYFHDPSTVISFTGFKFTFETDGVMVSTLVDAATLEEGIAVMSALYAAEAPEGEDQPTENETEADTEVTPPAEDQPEADTESTTEDKAEENTEELTEESTEAATEPVTQPENGNGSSEIESVTEKANDSAAKGCGAVTSFGSLTLIIMLAALALAGRKRERA